MENLNTNVVNEITETVEERESRFEKIRKSFKSTSIGTITNKFRTRRNKSLDIERIQTGYTVLDKELAGGLPVSSITCISAPPSVGKSTFMLQMAEQMAKQEIDIIYFNYEMSSIQVTSKSISRNYFLKVNKNQDKGILGEQLINSKRWKELKEEQWELSEQVADDMKDINDHIYLIDCTLKPLNIDQINQIVKEWVEAFKKTPVIMIDYLHMIVPPIDESGRPSLTTDKLILDYNMRGIRKMASEYKSPIVFISALRKDDFKSLADMSSLSGSSSIPYYCDIIINLQYGKLDDKDGKDKFDLEFEQKLSPRRIMIVVTKNRYGMVGGKIRFDYYSKFDYFDDAANGSQGYRNKSTKEDVSDDSKKDSQSKIQKNKPVKESAKVVHEVVDVSNIDMEEIY